MRKIYKACIGITIFILFYSLWVVVLLYTDPLMRSESSIRRYLLRSTPIGTSMSDVIFDAILHPEWSVQLIDRSYGVVLFPSSSVPTRMPGRWASPENIVGYMSVEAHLGTRRMIVRFDVTAFYAFDSDGKLIEILVRKEFDVI